MTKAIGNTYKRKIIDVISCVRVLDIENVLEFTNILWCNHLTRQGTPESYLAPLFVKCVYFLGTKTISTFRICLSEMRHRTISSQIGWSGMKSETSPKWESILLLHSFIWLYLKLYDIDNIIFMHWYFRQFCLCYSSNTSRLTKCQPTNFFRSF